MFFRIPQSLIPWWGLGPIRRAGDTAFTRPNGKNDVDVIIIAKSNQSND
jgi:hypothetical protein